MHGGDDLIQRDTVSTKRRIEAKGVGEGVVDREPVGPYVPVPRANDRTGREGQLHALNVLAGQVSLARSSASAPCGR